MKFCKIYELEDGAQVLIVRGMSDNEDGFRLQVVTEVNGVMAITDMGFDTEEDRDLALNEKFDKKMAYTYYMASKESIKSQNEGIKDVEYDYERERNEEI